MTPLFVAETAPNPNSRALMFGEVDPLPADWRRLVHEYGLRVVQAVMEDTRSIEEAEQRLQVLRATRQAEWLSTDYVTKRSFRNYRR